MTPKEKEYMDRYIYQVIRRLPRAQRDEVRMELEELISDMYTDKASMERVLTELGDPAKFSKQYQNDLQYLIGPEYFETYLWFVKVVLICAAVPILIISMINAIGQMPVVSSQNAASVFAGTITEGLAAGIADALLSCISAFGAVTLIFAVIERKKIQLDLEKKEKWSVKNLSEKKKTAAAPWTPGFLEPVPDKRAVISRGESMVGIVFIIIFCVLLIFAPHFFSAVFKEEGIVTMVPVFNLDQWERILPLCVITLALGLVDEILRLITGVYCRLVMISNLVCGVLQIALSAVILKVLPLWNPDFVTELKLAMGDPAEVETKFLTYWNADLISNGLLAFFVMVTLLEIGVTVYRTLCYGASTRQK